MSTAKLTFIGFLAAPSVRRDLSILAFTSEHKEACCQCGKLKT